MSDQAQSPRDPSAVNTDANSSDMQHDMHNEGAENTGATPSKPRKQHSRWRVLAYVLLSMFIIIALVIGGIFLYAKHIFDNIEKSDMLPNTNVTRDPAAGDAQNILLLGSDSRNQNFGQGTNSDVIQLIHISSDRKKIAIVHFPRDLYVNVPGMGKHKINYAYNAGGPKLLVQTLEQLTNVHIDHVAQVGFDGFEKITDDMGGVDLYVSQAFNEGGYGTWTVGTHHMNGVQARMYMQERHQLKLGDIDRGKDQQEWLLAMFTRMSQSDVLTNPNTLIKIANDASHNLAVDKSFSMGYMTGMAYSLRNINKSDMTFYTAPYTGFGYEAGSGDVDYVDQGALQKLSQGLRKDNLSGVTGGHVGSPVGQ